MIQDEISKKNYAYKPCEVCGREGVYFDDLEESVYLICEKYGTATSDVFCPDCGMGGAFVESIADRPKSWQCLDCSKVYHLSEGFYDKPKILYLESDLPKGFLKEFDKKNKR